MELIFIDKHISIYTKRIALEFYIEPILMNRYEAWTITKQVMGNVVATEIDTRLIDWEELNHELH